MKLIDPPSRLVLTWRGGPLDTLVTFELEEAGAATRLRLRHEGFKGFSNLVPRLVLGGGWKSLIRKKLVRFLSDRPWHRRDAQTAGRARPRQSPASSTPAPRMALVPDRRCGGYAKRQRDLCRRTTDLDRVNTVRLAPVKCAGCLRGPFGTADKLRSRSPLLIRGLSSGTPTMQSDLHSIGAVATDRQSRATPHLKAQTTARTIVTRGVG